MNYKLQIQREILAIINCQFSIISYLCTVCEKFRQRNSFAFCSLIRTFAVRMLILDVYLPITSPTLIFCVVLLIILFAPIIMGKLRIPHIIGMVLAGVLVGQYGLNILERDSSFEFFGKVGLLYIMFLAGLEMDLESVKRNSNRFLIFGLLTCLVPLVLTYVMSLWLLGYSQTASFLLGCIMASNTLIAYPIISRYGLGRDSSVMLSVGSSMLSLFMALLMLAALAASYGEDAGVTFWLLFILKFAMFLCCQHLAHPYFSPLLPAPLF